MYAVIEALGKQVRVSEGQKVCIDKLAGEPGSEVVFDKVLMIEKDGSAVYGKPYISGAKVKAEVSGHKKDDKVLVLRLKPKKANKKLHGHRQQYTTIDIKEIIGG
ncbi:MAG: 50S ribosomal protein L21 [Nitrospiraceae bacterium]|nr:50S ribosomal protein L21 [Nitrospiraceae bacterium]